MADGDLAYSHVPADNGALLCEMGGGALLYRKTRTYWKVDVAIHFEIEDWVAPWVEERMLDCDPFGQARPYPVAPTGSGGDWALSFNVGTFGQTPWRTGALSAFHKDFGFRDIGGASTLGGSPEGDGSEFPFSNGWSFPIGRAGGEIYFGRQIVLSAAAGPGGETVLSDSGTADSISINGVSSLGFTGWSLAITLKPLAHHPLCTHAAQ